jgi:3-hydroxybutyryl-CoA dehydratase
MENHKPRGMYFEDFAVGQKTVSAGRTVTEADVVSFAGLSGDFNQIHVDARYAGQGPFGQRVAHGLLVLSIASGLIVQTGVMEGTVLAFREISDWKFSDVVRLGDTIQAEMEVTGLKPFPRLKGGAVEALLTVRNQDGKAVMSGKWVVLIQNRPAG